MVRPAAVAVLMAAVVVLAGCTADGAPAEPASSALGQVGQAEPTPVETPPAETAPPAETTPQEESAPQAEPSPRAAANAGPRTVRKRLRRLVRSLPVRAERREGYDRDLYPHWSSQGDGCDTRDVVLYTEAKRRPRVGDGCALRGGRWRSYYDRVRTRDSSALDIDHMVPLAEAHDSGAFAWTTATREAFANDLDDRRSLVAVSASSNRSKSDRDPREWLPPRSQCRYLREYAAVKTRWSLAVDRGEKRAMKRLASSCANPTVRVRTARVATR